MNKRLTDLLSVCRKAGRIELGFESAKEALGSGKAALVILAADVSPKTEKEIRFFAEKNKVPVIKPDCTMDDYFRGVGKRSGVIAVCDRGFAEKAQQLASEN